MLTAANIFFSYGKVKTLDDISLAISDGQSICVIGANGSGKSTLAKVICGILKPTSGKITMQNKDITGKPAYVVVKEGIALVPEGRELFFRQSVQVNLELGAYHRSIKRSELNNDLEKVYSIFLRLKERKDQIAGSLSGGEQQMVAVGRALMAKPRLMILDEPSMGLSPLFVQEIAATIVKLKAEGTSIILIEQNAHMALEITDFGYVIESGKITLSGPSAELVRNPSVQHAYLGVVDERKIETHETAKKVKQLPSWVYPKK